MSRFAKAPSDRHAPLFSVVIPSYNRPDLVVRAASSVLQQTFPDFELIIVNDGSELRYSTVLEQLNDPRVRLAEAPKNQGAAAARNLGMREARGRYIAFLDDDDEYLDSFLAATLSTLQPTGRKVALSWCGVEWVDQTGGGVSHRRCEEFASDYPTERELLEEFLGIGTGFGVCVKSECLEVLGGFDEGLRAVEDTDWFIRSLAADYMPVVTPGVHVRVHNHDGGERLTGRKMLEVRARECAMLLERHASYLAEHKSLRGMLDFRVQQLALMLASGELRFRPSGRRTGQPTP